MDGLFCAQLSGVIDYKIIADIAVDACSEVRLCLTSGKCPLVILKMLQEGRRARVIFSFYVFHMHV